MLDYPILSDDLSFSQYITQYRDLIENRRFIQAIYQESIPQNIQHVIDANCPFEFFPEHPIRSNQRLKYGALLIHGLLDCPFSLKDIGLCLKNKGILTRAILLPGHGTLPSDLLQVSYHDWIRTVCYGIETLRQEVEHIFLIGYSTGAALSIYEAMHDSHISGIILISPAIKIKAPVTYAASWQHLLKWLDKKNNKEWFYQENEMDYTKYLSIPFNAINQVSKLTALISELNQVVTLTTPVLMVMSKEDEIVSSTSAIHFFSNLSNPSNRMLLYTSRVYRHADQRIISRQSQYPDLNIKHLSHSAIPFSPNNPHYGEKRDYSIQNDDFYLLGAYNRLEIKFYYFLYKLGLLKKRRSELTYNPDFSFMIDKMTQFILEK